MLPLSTWLDMQLGLSPQIRCQDTRMRRAARVSHRVAIIITLWHWLRTLIIVLLAIYFELERPQSIGYAREGYLQDHYGHCWNQSTWRCVGVTNLINLLMHSKAAGDCLRVQICAIDGSLIPISPVVNHTDYFNRKGWHSVVLQGVVDYRYQVSFYGHQRMVARICSWCTYSWELRCVPGREEWNFTTAEEETGKKQMGIPCDYWRCRLPSTAMTDEILPPKCHPPLSPVQRNTTTTSWAGAEWL